MKSVPNLAALHRKALATGASVDVAGASFNAMGLRAVASPPPPEPAKLPSPPPPDPVQELAKAVMAQAAGSAEAMRELTAQLADLTAAAMRPAPTAQAAPAPPRSYVFDVQRGKDGLIERVIARPAPPIEA